MQNKNLFFFLFLMSGIVFSFAQQKKYKTYTVQKGETLQSISQARNISVAEIRKLNPEITDNIDENQVIVIPNRDFNNATDIHNFQTDMIDERDIVIDGFVYHEVAPKETLFGITSKYRVSSADLKNYNPFLFTDGLQYGQTLKIPLPKKVNKINDTLFKPYVVRPKETKFSLAREYGISIDSLESLNPSIRKGLQIGDVIMVPAGKQKGRPVSGFEVYTVKKGETMYSLTRAFNLTEEELFAANPELREGVKEGMLIKIPERFTENVMKFIDFIPERASLKVAVMLPFQSNLDTLDFSSNKLLNAATDFYFGALVAIDSLKRQGLSVDVKVFDTQKSKFVSRKILERNSFKDTDVIIGPMYFSNIQEVAPRLKNEPVMIVSPISDKDHSRIKNRNLIQEVPTEQQLSDEMLRYIRQNYTNQKLTLFTDDKSIAKVNRLVSELKTHDSIHSIKVIKPHKGYISSEKLRKEMDTINENWVLIVGKDEVFIKDVIHNLGVLPENINLILYAFDQGKYFKNIDNNNLARVKFHYPSASYQDYNSEKFRYFSNAYRKRFFAFPSKYSVEGFDVTYDMLLRLLNENDITQQGISERLASKYHFVENTAGSVVNQGIYIISYDGLKLLKVE